MNLFMNLKENKELSKNEKILADYILKHPEDVLKMSSKELGKACFVSTATVYRLCDKLNLAGFSGLKIKITSSLNDYLKSDGDFNFDFPVNPYQTHYEIVHKIKEDYEQTLNLTANLFSLDQLRFIASAMKKAKVIDIYTSAGNINFALNFQFQMKEIGMDVQVNCTSDNNTIRKDPTLWDVYASAMVTAPTGDPQYFFTSCALDSSVSNNGHYHSDKLEELAAEIEKEFDTEKRSELGIQMQQTVLDDHAYVFCSHLKMSMIMQSNVTGLVAHPCDYYELTADLDIN